MRDTDERIEQMRRRTGELRHKREGTTLIMSGGWCMVLFAALLEVIMNYGGGTIATGTYAGTTLLNETAGGYVLVAVTAFMVGVAITVLLRARAETKAQNAPAQEQASCIPEGTDGNESAKSTGSGTGTLYS